jgi:enoyl-CoA hydratase/carnithine racemase
MNTVITEFEETIGTITLSHGKVNALSRELIGDICAALEEMKQRPHGW